VRARVQEKAQAVLEIMKTTLKKIGDWAALCFGALLYPLHLYWSLRALRSQLNPQIVESVSNSIPGALRRDRNQHAVLSFLSVKRTRP
jgi:hypothetical protein